MVQLEELREPESEATPVIPSHEKHNQRSSPVSNSGMTKDLNTTTRRIHAPCLSCRRHKVECDRTRPACQRCRVSRRECEWQASPDSKHQPNTAADVTTTTTTTKRAELHSLPRSEEALDSIHEFISGVYKSALPGLGIPQWGTPPAAEDFAVSLPSLASSTGTASTISSAESTKYRPFTYKHGGRPPYGSNDDRNGRSKFAHEFEWAVPPILHTNTARHEAPSSAQSLPSHEIPTPNVPLQSHDTELKNYLIDKLMRKVHELLGSTPSEASGPEASSLDESSDSTLSEGRPESLQHVYEVLDEGTMASIHSPSDASSGSQTHSQAGARGLRSSTGCNEDTPSKSIGKRARDSEDDKAEDEDREKRRKASHPSEDPQRRRRFACPFYKRNPEAHKDCTSCVWPGFETIARTKEHIYRKHVVHACQRCHETFESNEALLNHLASIERCIVVNEPLQVLGIDETQVRRLRPRSRGRLDEEKWRHIYRICHRLDDLAPTPSPYCDQDSLVLQAVEGYDQFQRSHLPGRIRELLEAEYETNSDLMRLHERLLTRLPDIIREGQRSLYETYRNFQRAVTPPNPSHAQPTFSANVGYDILPETEASAPPQPSVHTASPPAAFEAPPNTEYGMNLNEAQQVHSVSDQQRNSNNDSGYGGSTLVDSQSLSGFDAANGMSSGGIGINYSANEPFSSSYDFHDIFSWPQNTSFDPWSLPDTGSSNHQEPRSSLPKN